MSFSSELLTVEKIAHDGYNRSSFLAATDTNIETALHVGKEKIFYKSGRRRSTFTTKHTEAFWIWDRENDSTMSSSAAYKWLFTNSNCLKMNGSSYFQLDGDEVDFFANLSYETYCNAYLKKCTICWTNNRGSVTLATDLGKLKLKAGQGTGGFGFYFSAGYYERTGVVTDGSYVVVDCNTAEVKIKGNVNTVKNWVASALQSDSSLAQATNYFLAVLTPKNGINYQVVVGSEIAGVSLTTIQSTLSSSGVSGTSGTTTSGVTSGSSSGTGGSTLASLLDGSAYTSAYMNTSTYGTLINPKSSVTALEYINNFSDYDLVFKPGKDSRSSITKDLYDTPEEKVDVDTEQLIIHAKIPPIKLRQTNTEMTLSDKYYNYVEISKDLVDTEEFFTYLDECLNLDFTGEKIWKNDDAPFIKLKREAKSYSLIDTKWDTFLKSWKLLNMTAFAVDKEWFNNLTEDELENLDLKFTLQDKNADSKPIGLKDFFMKDTEDRVLYKLVFFDIEENKAEDGTITYTYPYSTVRDFNLFLSEINPFINFAEYKELAITLTFSQERLTTDLYELLLFEAYTRGHDFIQEDYTTVRPQEQDVNGKRLMDFDENYFIYKYSGRDFDLIRDRNKEQIFDLPQSQGVYCAMVHEKDLLLETDVTLGDTYGWQKYFIEYLKYYDEENNKYFYKDTFKVTDFVKAIDATKYTEDDYEVIISKIDLTQCKYYNPNKATFENSWCDCCYNDGEKGDFNKECAYQKLGYCPYRFEAEKHPRRIRTLSQEKSNRFNIIQELSKVFEIYPIFYIEFDRNGRILLDKEGRMKKHVFFMTEKGKDQFYGFRYEKNLNSITRTIDSTSLTTKMFVESIDSELSNTGLCSIETAEDNVSRTSYIIDFSYYTKKNLLDAEQVTRDLYGIDKTDLAFLPTIGYYNKQYDELSDLIINMTGETLTEMQAQNIVYIEGITAALEERQKIAQQMYQFKIKNIAKDSTDYTTSDTYKNYLVKYKEQATILWGNVENLFFSNDYCNLISKEKQDDGTYKYSFVNYGISSDDTTGEGQIKAQQLYISKYKETYCNGELFYRLMIEGFDEELEKGIDPYEPIFQSWQQFKEQILDTEIYPTDGKMGQYKALYDQVKEWKKRRAVWLNKINDISDTFYKKYEPYIKEGTWTDEDYLTDNEYYWAAVQVLADSCKPKLTYNIEVTDLSPLDEDYKFELGDTTYIEDIDFFDINKKTGLPNKEKVLISAITYNLDQPQSNSLTVQNYTSSFDDLFQAITASVQSLTFNENMYKRASNFTATKYISKESLQGTLFDGDLTLMQTANDNITVDENGTKGKDITNSAVQYQLTGEGMQFSKDGGQTWDVGIGPNGINADYIKFGQLDASKIQIVDGNYIYFLWDKSGITAYRNPATSTTGLVDFTRFNKYGLSLIENNNVRLRAGYEFRTAEQGNNTTGNYNSEVDLTTQNIGFYLYNDSGQPIFKTETASDYSGVQGDYSARLSLTGEMFVTNKVLDSDGNRGNIISTAAELDYSGGYAVYDQDIVSLNVNDEFSSFAIQFYQGQDYCFSLNNLNDDGKIIPGTGDVEDNWEKGDVNIKDDIETNNGTTTEDDTSTEEQVIEKKITVYKVENIYEKLSVFCYYDAKTSRIVKAKENELKEVVFSYSLYEIKFTEDELNAEDGSVSLDQIKEKIEALGNSSSYYSVSLYKKPYESTMTKGGIEGDSEYERKIAKLNGVEVSALTNRTRLYSGHKVAKKCIVATDANAHFTTTENVSQTQIEAYDISTLAEGESTDLLQTYTLYNIEENYGSIVYQYWYTKTETGNTVATNTSSIETDEVGIFINNKTSIHGGSDIVKQYNSEIESTIVNSGTDEDEETVNDGSTNSDTTVNDATTEDNSSDISALATEEDIALLSDNGSISVASGTTGWVNLNTACEAEGGTTNENYKPIFHATYYYPNGDVGTIGGSGNNLIDCSKGDGTVKGSVACHWAYNYLGHTYIVDGGRAKVYIKFPDKYSTMDGYYYLDDSNSDGRENILFDFYYESAASAKAHEGSFAADGSGAINGLTVWLVKSSGTDAGPDSITQSLNIDVDSTDFVLIGDSITVGMSSTPLKDRAVGIGSCSIDPSRISHTGFYGKSSIQNAKYFAFFFGMNDVNANYTEEKYKEMYKACVENILSQNNHSSFNPDNVFLISCIHTASSFCSDDEMTSFNTNYIKASAEAAGYHYVDIDEASKAVEHSSDGIHCTTDGYNQIYEILKTAFSKISTSSDGSGTTRDTDPSVDAARETILAGSERVFMTALAGKDEDNETVYHNILSILKNGCLYIGGTVSDFYGRKLDMSSFSLMPDEVRINDVKIVMSNDGKVWMDFHNLYAIDEDGNLTDVSLWEILSQMTAGGTISSDSSSTDTSGLAAGYYLIDPLGD